MTTVTQMAKVSRTRAKRKSDEKANKGPVETQEERVRRLYAAQGGPLMGWLFDEARSREHDMNEMAHELGLTCGYINQLRLGMRSTAHLCQPVVEACARYLGVPAIVVKVVSGSIVMRDFVSPKLTEEQVYDRALQRMREDPEIRQAIPVTVGALPLEAKRALAMLYAESTCGDLFGHRELPQILQYLQRAVVNHDSAEFEALYGHADTAVQGAMANE